MPSPAAHIGIYREAAERNRSEPLRTGLLLRFPNHGQLVMTGDLHGHQRNLDRIQNYCDLMHAPARHVILHEIIHADTESLFSPDLSHLVLLQAARWKCEFPDQVHFLLGNHELSQLTRHEISKGGRYVTQDFLGGVARTYAEDAQAVYEALLDFIGSFALAARTANRVFLCHSLPGLSDLARFDPSILERALHELDLSERGSAYPLVWGRNQTEDVLDLLANTLDVDLFVCGHQPEETGYEVVHERMLVLASDHNRGMILPFDLRKRHTMRDLVRLMRPLASIA